MFMVDYFIELENIGNSIDENIFAFFLIRVCFIFNVTDIILSAGHVSMFSIAFT